MECIFEYEYFEIRKQAEVVLPNADVNYLFLYDFEITREHFSKRGGDSQYQSSPFVRQKEEVGEGGGAEDAGSAQSE
jgi:hypothetical protein